ncbi:MAG TPA: phosphoribosyltransferase [Thermomicrobiales bacterium]|nr:phosphoribosyltransferase [Thermomicrobiales bacterium]
MKTRYRNRYEAGRVLTAMLAPWKDTPGLLVLALPRGGVPIGYEIALALDAPLDVFLVRKLGVPGHSELAMGAIASGGVMVLNEDVVVPLRISDETLEQVVEREARELERRSREYRGARPEPDVSGRTVILVDDGLATGSTMMAALKALRKQQPTHVIVAVPVASPLTLDDIAREADEIVCPMRPDPLHAVGIWYEDFSETTDDEVRMLLRQAAAASAARY